MADRVLLLEGRWYEAYTKHAGWQMLGRYAGAPKGDPEITYWGDHRGGVEETVRLAGREVREVEEPARAPTGVAAVAAAAFGAPGFPGAAFAELIAWVEGHEQRKRDHAELDDKQRASRRFWEDSALMYGRLNMPEEAAALADRALIEWHQRMDDAPPDAETPADQPSASPMN